MKKLIKKIYMFLPEGFQMFISRKYRYLSWSRRLKQDEQKNLELIKKEYQSGKLDAFKNEIEFETEHGFNMFPNRLSQKYPPKVKVYSDETGLPYVEHKGKKLYFPRKYSKDMVSWNYIQLLKEQDEYSAHRYWSDINRPDTEDIFIDVGAAEGMIALEEIDTVKKAYLFEPEEQWIEALEATFSAYKDKVEIINKFCGDHNSADTVTLDTMFADTVDHLCLKMDIEGAEEDALRGAAEILKRENIKYAVCVYHDYKHPEMFEELFRKNGIEYEFSEGYLLIPRTNPVFPYFNRGMIRGRK